MVNKNQQLLKQKHDFIVCNYVYTLFVEDKTNSQRFISCLSSFSNLWIEITNEISIFCTYTKKLRKNPVCVFCVRPVFFFSLRYKYLFLPIFINNPENDICVCVCVFVFCYLFFSVLFAVTFSNFFSHGLFGE
jgi:hypothetical protein